MSKTFSKALMMSEDVKSYVGSCIFQANSVNAPVSDGALVTLGNLVADTTYAATGDYDWNLYIATAPAAVTDDVAIIDLAEISAGTIGGNNYKIGVQIFDLVQAAGKPARFRRLAKYDKFWLSAGCFATTPTVGKFAGATASSVNHTPADTKPVSGYAVKIQAKTALTTGNVSAEDNYLVEVVQL